ncbi:MULTISPECIES: ribonuclease HII [unclassified Treponema]|uniref:ribonuclease HII n=1 Tax=unclassified Treponema TaxID=2638727 RepID=UPI0020A2ADBE|nr:MULTISPECIES: ribonuclease HII [unclassified Treponema]UTC68085.1 ribonuclease HII [Treponema sp. OMZ 789]UTC70807.1 ribonuclease HII [Treponema sp. OMZ 790]UTC73547.1 ribonuclease HII [Treponema sp. OMZ 791]
MFCGIDEAGRGPLAGPVTAAAVILPDNFVFSILKDSKKLSEKKRESVRKILYSNPSVIWGIGRASNYEIDEINILQATFLAMERAYDDLYIKLKEYCKIQNIKFEEPDIIVDGNSIPNIKNCSSIKAVVKADDSVHEVMAASILAKTARDRIMTRYSWFYPEYGYEKHKGYATKAHVQAIRLNGYSPIQRKSFSIKDL